MTSGKPPPTGSSLFAAQLLLAAALLLVAALLLTGCEGGADRSAGGGPELVDSEGMDPGSEQLSNGKPLGAQSKQSLKQAVAGLEGWQVTSAGQSNAAGSRIITVSATNASKDTLRIDWYEIPDDKLREKRRLTKQGTSTLATYADGDFFMTLQVTKSGGVKDAAAARSVLAELTR